MKKGTRHWLIEGLVRVNWVGVAIWFLILFGFVTFNAYCEEPKVELTVSPKYAVFFPGRPPIFTFRLQVKNPDEKLYCPEIQWTWSDGTVSTHQEDCDPFNDVEPKYRDTYEVKRVAFGPGIHTISVRLVKSNKVIKVLSVTIQVIGDE